MTVYELLRLSPSQCQEVTIRVDNILPMPMDVFTGKTCDAILSDASYLSYQVCEWWISNIGHLMIKTNRAKE